MSARDAGDWRNGAACGPMSADAFDVVVGYGLADENKMALKVCRGCPVQAECEADATANPHEFGRWIAGGRVHRGVHRMDNRSWAVSA